MTPFRLVANLICVTALAGLSVAADPPAPPRYKFEPGQVMTYRLTSTTKYATGEHGNKGDWTVWVVRANKDGSFRLVIKQESSFYQVIGDEKVIGDKEKGKPTNTKLGYVDVFPDGRILPSGTLDQEQLEYIFPRLPKDAAEAASGWSWERDGGKVSAKPVKADKGFAFETTNESPAEASHLISNSNTYTIDPDLGRLASATSTFTQDLGRGFKGKGAGATEVVEVKAADPAEFKKLVAEERTYFESVEAYQKAVRRAGSAAAKDVEKRLEAAAAAFKTATDGLTHPVLKAEAEARLKRAAQSVKYSVEDAERRAKLVGKPAEAFVTTDIDGKEVKLADLKGNVVVLDFWYRGCGYCIKAMPQMNGLVDDFAGKKVVILGMNTDEKDEDARFVIKKMELKYPTLKAKGLPEKFGVEGFPTLIVIDQEGNVHDIHGGYSPTLREDVGAKIKALLEQKK